jgi:hypothetical protein
MFPYLFIIAMEFLTKGMNRTADEGRIEGVRLVPNEPRLTHALYADNVILFGQATEVEAEGIRGTRGIWLALRADGKPK